jgi:hypothetical protein
VTDISIPAYEGNDMAGFMMDRGFKFCGDPLDSIKSITNIRDTAVIVKEWSIYLAEPHREIGFCVKLLCHLRY